METVKKLTNRISFGDAKENTSECVQTNFKDITSLFLI